MREAEQRHHRDSQQQAQRRLDHPLAKRAYQDVLPRYFPLSELDPLAVLAGA